MDRIRRTWQRWAVPAACVVIAVAYFVAGMLGDQPDFALGGAGLMLAVGGAFPLVTRFSETAQGLRDRRDERINAIDRDASLVSGMSVLLAVLVMFVIDIARGGDGQPYAALGAIGGLGYVAALIWYRFRR